MLPRLALGPTLVCLHRLVGELLVYGRQNMEKKRLVGITVAARIIGVHPNTLRRWADEGLVPHVHLPSG
jgi:hypothetical protein